jgi:tetratricopeptide (TPR) repeat protein
MNALLAAVLLLAAGTTSEQLRPLAKLPTISLNFNFGFQSSDFGIAKNTNTTRRAEAELRAILKENPADSVAWSELGGRLMGRALNNHLHVESIKIEDINGIVRDLREGRLSTNDVHQATRLLDESLDCYDKAIQTSPQRIDGYVQRALYRMAIMPCAQGLRNALEDKETDFFALIFSPQVLADFQQVARLCPDNAEAQTTSASYTLMWEAKTKRLDMDPGTGWGKFISESARALIRENCVHLERLATTNDTQRAATAHEGLGMIHLMLDGGNGGAGKHFRRAIALDPTRDRAWDILTGLQVTAQRFDLLLGLCHDRVKAADTVRNRFLLAKAHEQLNQPDKTEEQLDLILKREPDNFLAATGKAAVQLRRGDTARAAEWLARADKLAADSVAAEQRADLRSLHAIHAALRGDRDAAEFHLGHAFKLDKDNKNARAVLRALEP